MSIVGSSVNLKQAEEAWLTTQVISPSKYDAFITMLTVFARHLEACSLSLIEDSPTSTSASPAIKRAQRFIVDHLADDISLGDVAREVNLSAPYFCKHFRESAGISFVEYLTRVRAERARELLMNPELRISEAAYLAGFQSVSQFNRVFRRIVGESPSNWRRKQRARAAIPGIDAQQAH
jgi:AraC-like DNA-binding protein